MILGSKSTSKALHIITLGSSLLLYPFWGAHAQPQMQSSIDIITGNAVVPPTTIERVVRKVVADSLKGHFFGESIDFTTDAIKQEIPLDPKGMLKDILQTLGMKSPIQIQLDPLQAKILFPQESLQLSVKSTTPNQFSIKAKWSISRLTVKTDHLRIQVPKGLLDQDVEIESQGVVFGLSKKSPPITVELELTAEMSQKGTSIHLDQLNTNLKSDDVRFFAKLGPLTVEGQPLQLEITTQGKHMVADEASIREEFMQLDPALLQSVKLQLSKIIQDRFTVAAQSIEKAPPVHFGIESDPLVSKSASEASADNSTLMHSLLDGIKIDFLFSYLQYVKSFNLFTAQVSSHICIANDCLKNIETQSKIDTSDLKPMTADEDVGILLYESLLQNFVHSDSFQRRIQKYYEAHPSPGVKLSKNGALIHFNPAKNAISIVLNLGIDIRKTAKPGAGGIKRATLTLAKWLESRWGSGKLVTIPIEITVHPKKVRVTAEGQYVLSLTTELPFHNDGTITNTYHYPSNVDDMTDWVKKSFLKTVKDAFAPSIPPTLDVPLGRGVNLKGFHFAPKRVIITPNRGLLMTGEMMDAKVKP